MATTQEIPAQDASGNIIASDLAKKVAITEAVGGLAVAAAGENEDAIRKGFLQAGAMVLIQEGYQSYTHHALDDKQLRASKGKPYCISMTVDCQAPPEDAKVYDNGKFVGLDQRKLDSFAPHVGTGYPDTPIGQEQVAWPTEGSPFMQSIFKIPGTNAMAVFHDQWALDWRMPSGILQPTIVPAVVMIYNGTTAPLLETIRVAAKPASPAQAADGGAAGADSSSIAYRDDTAKIPIQKKQVATAYTCANADETRSITLEVDPEKINFACRVM